MAGESRALQVKYAVRVRDGFRCVQCGMSDDEHRAAYGKSLHVHRKTPGAEYSLENCQTLCVECHGPKPKSPRGTGKHRMIRLSPDSYAILRELARRRGRPLGWELKAIIAKGLREAGLPVPADAPIS